MISSMRHRGLRTPSKLPAADVRRGWISAGGGPLICGGVTNWRMFLLWFLSIGRICLIQSQTLFWICFIFTQMHPASKLQSVAQWTQLTPGWRTTRSLGRNSWTAWGRKWNSCASASKDIFKVYDHKSQEKKDVSLSQKPLKVVSEGFFFAWEREREREREDDSWWKRLLPLRCTLCTNWRRARHVAHSKTLQRVYSADLRNCTWINFVRFRGGFRWGRHYQGLIQTSASKSRSEVPSYRCVSCYLDLDAFCLVSGTLTKKSKISWTATRTAWQRKDSTNVRRKSRSKWNSTEMSWNLFLTVVRKYVTTAKVKHVMFLLCVKFEIVGVGPSGACYLFFKITFWMGGKLKKKGQSARFHGWEPEQHQARG